MANRYEFFWYKPKACSVPNFFQKIEGGKNNVSSVTLSDDHAELVHIFNNLNGGKERGGAIPDADMKKVKEVVLAGKDALANMSTICGHCKEERSGEQWVQCDLCNCWRHHCCASPAVVDGEDWVCSSCTALFAQLS